VVTTMGLSSFIFTEADATFSPTLANASQRVLVSLLTSRDAIAVNLEFHIMLPLCICIRHGFDTAIKFLALES
jgi:hypothetical protein